MIEPGVIGYLTSEELEKYRRIEATIEVIASTDGNPFSAREAVQAHIDRMVFIGCLYPEYQIKELKRDIWVSAYTGAITFADEADVILEDDE